MLILKKILYSKTTIVLSICLSFFLSGIVGLIITSDSLYMAQIPKTLNSIQSDYYCSFSSGNSIEKYNILEEELKRMNNVDFSFYQTYSKNIQNETASISSFNENINISNSADFELYGIDLNTWLEDQRYQSLFGFKNISFNNNDNIQETLISKNLAEDLNLSLGDKYKVVINKNGSYTKVETTVIGILDIKPKLTEIYYGVLDQNEFIDVGSLFSRTHASFSQKYWVLGNLSWTNSLHSMMYDSNYSIFNDLNINIDNIDEFKNRRILLKTVNDVKENIFKIFQKNFISDYGNIENRLSIILKMDENLTKFQFLIYLTMFPFFLFLGISLINLQKINLMKDVKSISVLYLRGKSKFKLLLSMVEESFLILFLGFVVTPFLSNIYIKIYSIIFHLSSFNFFSFFAFNDVITNFSDLTLFYFSIGAIIQLFSAVFSFFYISKNKLLSLSKNTKRSLKIMPRNLDLKISLLGVFSISFVYLMKNYFNQFLNNSDFLNAFYQLLNSSTIVFIIILPITIISFISRMYGVWIFKKIEFLLLKIRFDFNRAIIFTNKNSRLSKNLIYPIIFIISCNFFILFSSNVILYKENSYEEKLLKLEIPGDIKFVDISNPDLQNDIKELVQNNNSNLLFSIYYYNMMINEFDPNSQQYNKKSLQIIGLNITEYLKFNIDMSSNIVNALSTIKENQSNIIANKFFLSNFNFKLNSNIEIFPQNSEVGLNFTINEKIDEYLPGVSLNSNPFLILDISNIRFNNSGFESNQIDIQIKSNLNSPNELKTFFIQNLPNDGDIQILTKQDIKENIYNPSLSLGIEYSVISNIKNLSLFAIAISLVGYALILILNLFKSATFLSNIHIYGISKSEISKFIYRSLITCFIYAILFIPLAILYSILYLQLIHNGYSSFLSNLSRTISVNLVLSSFLQIALISILIFGVSVLVITDFTSQLKNSKLSKFINVESN